MPQESTGHSWAVTSAHTTRITQPACPFARAPPVCDACVPCVPAAPVDCPPACSACPPSTACAAAPAAAPATPAAASVCSSSSSLRLRTRARCTTGSRSCCSASMRTCTRHAVRTEGQREVHSHDVQDQAMCNAPGLQSVRSAQSALAGLSPADLCVSGSTHLVQVSLCLSMSRLQLQHPVVGCQRQAGLSKVELGPRAAGRQSSTWGIAGQCAQT